ncbi:hypothetical protein BH10ACT8_BH10ACT8_20180 [soil metagenome]
MKLLRVKRKSVAVLAAFGLAVAVQASTAPSASATTCGTFHSSSLFDGFYSYDVGSVEGLSANIRTETANICTFAPTLPNDSYTFTFVGNQTGGYAQIGYNQDSSHGPTYYYEANVDGTSGNRVGGYWHSGIGAGTTHRYWVQWTTYLCPGGCFALNIDTTRVAQTSWDPYATWTNPTSTPWIIQATSETKYAETGVSGHSTGGVATVWDSLSGQRFSDNTYVSVPCSMPSVTNEPVWGLNYASNAGCGTWSTYSLPGS